MDHESLNKALQLWQADRPLEAGWLLYEQLPNDVRPIWAAGALDLCRRLRPFPLAVRAGSWIAKRPRLWRWGHVAFGQVRALTLQFERNNDGNEIYGGILYLAKNVAKVTYNATQPSDPFDEDAGAWVVSCLHFLVTKVDDPVFARDAWLAVTSAAKAS